jgi:hypothetical protein
MIDLILPVWVLPSMLVKAKNNFVPHHKSARVVSIPLAAAALLFKAEVASF